MKEMHFISTLFQPSISLVKETIQVLKCAEFISEAEINMRIVDEYRQTQRVEFSRNAHPSIIIEQRF